MCCVVALPTPGRSYHLTNVKAGGIKRVEFLCIEKKTEVWGRSPAARGQWGFGGRAPDTAAILQVFSKKIR